MNTKNDSKQFDLKMNSFGGIFDLAETQQQINELTAEVSAPGFWDDANTAQEKMSTKTRLERELKRWEAVDTELEEADLLIELIREEKDASLEKDLEQTLNNLQLKMDSLTIETLFTGERDLNNAIVTIHPGAGGTESQDWAQMLTRMYYRWIERKGFEAETLDLQAGDEAGIKSVTLLVKGPYAYGYFRAEAGVHRLVRISPFDANKRRHTSFASVFVSPEVEDDVDIEIDEKEIRVDTFRASGAGGQHVNKTSSAIRITHLPTGFVTQCQNERSQRQNKLIAMRVLKSHLYELQQEEKREKMAKMAGEKKEIGWGNQIRSYVFQPYQMVKDHRTGVEVGNVSAVMDGDISVFVDGYLKRPKGQ